MEQVIMDRYTKSSRCLFLLDYDGTLAEFKKYPKDARLTRSQLETLQELCSNPRNTVVIISGRDHETLDEWLADRFIKEQGKPWKVQGSRNQTWKRAIRPIIKRLIALVPGSFIEEKEFSLVWHYWDTDDEVAAAAIQKAQPQIDIATARFGLTIISATKDLEFTISGMDKSQAAERWLSRRNWDFILAAGDDTGDEVLFKAMPENVFTIKIGSGKSAARYRLASPKAFSSLLKQFNVPR
jgi:trehalose 6-phosphate synthase/phosphatase